MEQRYVFADEYKTKLKENKHLTSEIYKSSPCPQGINSDEKSQTVYICGDVFKSETIRCIYALSLLNHSALKASDDSLQTFRTFFHFILPIGYFVGYLFVGGKCYVYFASSSTKKAFIMKAKKILLLCILILAGTLNSRAITRDTVWTTYHWDGYKISVLGGNLYQYSSSKVTITPDNPKEEINVSIDNGKIEKTGNNWYLITPGKLRKTNITINDKTYQLSVESMPEPRVFLNHETQDWKDPSSSSKGALISHSDLLASTGFLVKNKFQEFRVVSFSLDIVINGVLKELYSINGQFSEKQLEAIRGIGDNEKFYITNIQIFHPDGSVYSILPKEYRVIDTYENEFIRQTVQYKPYTYELNRFKTDLRIKIAGYPSEKDRQTVIAFSDTLSSIMQSIKVSVVEQQPTLTIVFDTVNDTTLLQKGYSMLDNWPPTYIKKTGNLLYPFYTHLVMVISVDHEMEEEWRCLAIQRAIFLSLGNFKEFQGYNAPAPTILDGQPFSSYDRYLLQTLYAKNGEYRISTILDQNFDYPDRTPLYIFIILWTLGLSFALMELYSYFGIQRILRKLKNKFVIRVIESLFISQVPVLGFLLLLGMYEGSKYDYSIFYMMEQWLVPLYILWGLMFLGIDYFLKRIKKYGLQMIINFILSFFGIILSYQIIYCFLIPQFIDISTMDWKLIIIPFILTFYRMTISFQQNKISGILQEKELELSRQKELKFKSDLNALQARINPHFLYNALNSIASLAHTDAKRTEHMAMSLSKLFRYNINKDNGMEATLKEEAEMTEVYLEVEKIRFGEKLNYTIELEESLNSVKVPKFILQPLVENAVKHGISQISTQGIIKIRIFELGGKIIIEVYDNGPAFPGGLMTGYGLQNTYEKLSLLYKKPFDIEFINNPEKMIRIILNQ